ncbi:pilin [bacterium]|nr:pilin [bacterium]
MNRIITKVYASTLSDTLNQVTELEGQSGVGDIVGTIVKIAMPLAGIVAILLIVGASLKMITSQGNPEKLNDAKEMITNAVVGLVFILLSVAILLLISNVFDLNISGT